MAPTEVLADQHYLGLSVQFAQLGVRMALLKGSQTAAERKAVRKTLEAGETDVVVGTHALIQQGVRFRDLRLAVVDEQHRFGVSQRDAILAGEGSGTRPHTLHMSATPIPRTLSLTLYGDLDVSVLDEMPAGRRPVVTRLVGPEGAERMWESVRGQIRSGRQVYVVCPLIEESDVLEAASARQTFEELSAGELAGIPPAAAARPTPGGGEGCGHGRLRRAQGGRPGEHVGHRSGGGRAQCYSDGHPRRPPFRVVAVAPVAGPGGPGRRRFVLLPARRRRGRGRSGAPARVRGDQRRVRPRGGRPSGPGDGAVVRRAPVGVGRPACGLPAPRPGTAGRGAN